MCGEKKGIKCIWYSKGKWSLKEMFVNEFAEENWAKGKVLNGT